MQHFNEDRLTCTIWPYHSFILVLPSNFSSGGRICPLARTSFSNCTARVYFDWYEFRLLIKSTAPSGIGIGSHNPSSYYANRLCPVVMMVTPLGNPNPMGLMVTACWIRDVDVLPNCKVNLSFPVSQDRELFQKIEPFVLSSLNRSEIRIIAGTNFHAFSQGLLHHIH